MKKTDLRKLCKNLGHWWWMDTSPYKNVGNAESHEAALNILWLIKGCPPRILQKHLDADMGKARTVVSDIVEGRRVEDWALLLKPAEFLQLVERNPDVFGRYWSLARWREATATFNDLMDF